MINETSEKKTVQSILPSVNILETSKSYVVSLDIPGALKDRITANIESNTLFVSADIASYSNAETTDVGKQYRREFSLANDVDANTVDAHYDTGVLTVTLNKKEQFLPKQIRIN